MMKRNFLTMAAAAVLCMLSAGQARAAVTFDYIPEQGIYTATAGQLVTVNVLLRETLTNGSASIIPPENGIATVGVRLNLTSGNAKITGETPKTTAFTGQAEPAPVTDTTAGFLIQKDPKTPDGVQPDTKTATVSTYVLGSFTIQAGATSGTSTFRLLQLSTGGPGNSYTWNSVLDLDAGNSIPGDGPVFVGTNNAPVSTFSVTVNAVPEPGSLCLLAGVAMIGLRRRRR